MIQHLQEEDDEDALDSSPQKKIPPNLQRSLSASSLQHSELVSPARKELQFLLASAHCDQHFDMQGHSFFPKSANFSQFEKTRFDGFEVGKDYRKRALGWIQFFDFISTNISL